MVDKLHLNNRNLSKALRAGLLALAIGTGSSFAAGCSIKDEKPANLEIQMDEKEQVDLADINQLNLILCNDHCNQEIFDEVTSAFQRTGIDILVANSLDDAIVNNKFSTVITLDDSYRSDHVKIIGPYDNDRGRNDDTLAIAMESSLKAHGIGVDGIGLGAINLGQDITKRAPSETENKVDASSSFVGIAIGTQIDPSNKREIAEGIVDGVTRAAFAITQEENQDLLHRSTYEDRGYESLAQHMGTSISDLARANPNIDFSDDQLLQNDETIVHPKAENLRNLDQKFEVKHELPEMTFTSLN